MPSLNRIGPLMGHLTADLELKHTQDGTPFVSFTIGINGGKRADGEDPRTDFIPVELWGGWAENLAKTARKGSLILVAEGRLQQDRWVERRSNQPRSRIKVRASRAFHVEAQYAEDVPEPADDVPEKVPF